MSIIHVKLNRVFVDALRECLGMRPLYEDIPMTEVERFAGRAKVYPLAMHWKSNGISRHG